MSFRPLLLAALFMATPALSHEFKAGALMIDHPMLREMPPAARVGGGYVKVTNTGATADRLVAIETPAAETVELHRSVVSEGMATMQRLAEGLEIPAGATVALGDDGTHAMFINPSARFLEGQSIDAVLVFDVAGNVPVTFKVEGMGAQPNESASHDHASFSTISPDQLSDMLKHKDFALVNVHIPYEGEIAQTDAFIQFDKIGDHLAELPSDKDAPIVLYCRSGRMSEIAAADLAARGYTNVSHLAGGMNAWSAAGNTLLKH